GPVDAGTPQPAPSEEPGRILVPGDTPRPPVPAVGPHDAAPPPVRPATPRGAPGEPGTRAARAERRIRAVLQRGLRSGPRRRLPCHPLGPGQGGSGRSGSRRGGHWAGRLGRGGPGGRDGGTARSVSAGKGRTGRS